ncbi:hypothetical protein BJV78DRAFT_885846 [Lactifluus subvellereus]|nr:hypothetical protein BJV78DRAFT_885846 [Lactifluus subvellereus]
MCEKRAMRGRLRDFLVVAEKAASIKFYSLACRPVMVGGCMRASSHHVQRNFKFSVIHWQVIKLYFSTSHKMSDTDDRHPLGTIEETASSHSGSFTYPTETQEGPGPQDVVDEEEEEFVYPNVGDDDAASDAPPLQISDIITSTASPSESQVAVPLESSDLAESPSSKAALHETSPSRPLPDPSPAPPPQTRASPAQLEALYAAASSGDLSLLQKIIQNASQTGNVEPFSLVNDASSRTGLTALHAAANRGYIDIVKWLVESCGAIPDLEDKEGEV